MSSLHGGIIRCSTRYVERDFHPAAIQAGTLVQPQRWADVPLDGLSKPPSRVVWWHTSFVLEFYTSSLLVTDFGLTISRATRSQSSAMCSSMTLWRVEPVRCASSKHSAAFSRASSALSSVLLDKAHWA